jgi:hypothetical protein
MRPDQHPPRTLTEAKPIPADLVRRLADAAIDYYEQLSRDGRPAGEALWPPVEDPTATSRAARIAAAEFETTTATRDWTTATRDWTVPAARVQQLAADAIDLYVEGYVFDYDRDQARAASVRECLEGEAARAEVPPPERHAEALAESGTPDVAGFAKLVERAERVRGGGER